MEPIIEAVALEKKYHNRMVIQRISFTVTKGECFGILGPNGAGKSTTLRMIEGLTPRDDGELRLFGQPTGPEHREARQRVGVVPQEDNLDIDLSVEENLAVYGSYFGLPQTTLRPRIKELLAFAQLEERADSTVRSLSGGMRRRLIVARSLMAGPELVILDEPTSGLDPQARHLIWQRLRALKETGVTLLLTTHYMEEAAQLCDRVMILDQGRILDLDTPANLIARHVEREVLELRGENGHFSYPDLKELGCRVEPVGNTIYCYTNESAPLRAALLEQEGITLMHRPANLEDVFLKLTGRELRD